MGPRALKVRLRIDGGFPPVNLSSMKLEMSLSPDALFSTAALISGVCLAALMYWLEKRPRKDLRPRLFPTTLVMLIAIMLVMGAGFHLLSLGGFSPPQRQP